MGNDEKRRGEYQHVQRREHTLGNTDMGTTVSGGIFFPSSLSLSLSLLWLLYLWGLCNQQLAPGCIDQMGPGRTWLGSFA